ncbi:MAG: hypothetical protein LBR60_07195 [Fibrobacter sp.]|jgi:hypothetical protein|nr:hypothetical protein [Fibrobacter sp.]
MKKAGLFLTLSLLLFGASSVFAQAENASKVFAAKDLYDGLKKKSLRFSDRQEIIITGVLKSIGSSFIYNSSYLLISDRADGKIYVKAILADKDKKTEYKEGQEIKIRSFFYEERDNVIVVKGTEKFQGH